MSTGQTPERPSTTPPPPTTSSTPLIVAVVAMLLLIAGLLFWKFSGKKEKEAAPVATTTALAPTADTTPVLDEPPPPPPPPEEPTSDAAPATSKATTGKVASTGGGGCSATCDGTPAPQFSSQLQALAGRSRSCYERALLQNSELKGRLSVSVKVSPTGQVCSAKVTSNQTGDEGLSTCVTQIFRSATFAPPKNGCVEAAVPLNFVPKQ